MSGGQAKREGDPRNGATGLRFDEIGQARVENNARWGEPGHKPKRDSDQDQGQFSREQTAWRDAMRTRSRGRLRYTPETKRWQCQGLFMYGRGIPPLPEGEAGVMSTVPTGLVRFLRFPCRFEPRHLVAINER